MMDAKEQLHAMAKAQLAPAQQMILEGHELDPTLCFELESGIGLASIPQYGNPKWKAAALVAMRELLKAQDAIRYAFTMEAWTGETDRADYVPGYLPSKDPNRHKAIIVSAADCEGNKLLLKCRIIRGETITFAEPEVLNISSGPLLELLDVQPTIN